jgi:hypothetical protein
MPLKNYTTEVSAMKSIGEIQGNLVAHGAVNINIHFNVAHEPDSLTFVVPAGEGFIPFRLPANIPAVFKVLERQLTSNRYKYASPGIKTQRQKGLQERALKVGWRILKDWIDAQLAIIETEMVTLEQVFLPYMKVKDDKTLYEVMEGRGFLLPEGKG